MGTRRFSRCSIGAQVHANNNVGWQRGARVLLVERTSVHDGAFFGAAVSRSYAIIVVVLYNYYALDNANA